MINVISKRCIGKDCKKRPNYNFEGEKGGIYCFDHKHNDMINVTRKNCIESNCKKYPVYNFEGETKGIYCDIHKHNQMIDVINKKCIEPNCKKYPIYNFEGKKGGIYCFDHKHNDMINVMSKTCIEPNCKKRRSYNFEGEKGGIYCFDHKHDGMINVVNKKCIEPECKKIPSYNFEGEKRGIYCFDHKIYNMVDVTHKKCDYKDCKSISTYSYPNNSPNRCTSHKDEGMIKNPRRKCFNNLCRETSIFGLKIPIHCEKHKETNEISLIEKKCRFCNRIDVVNDEGICINFCLLEEKYAIYKKNVKAKELRILEICKEKFGDPTAYDKKIEYSCYNERPDIVYDMKTHIVIIEVDENQHKNGNNYNVECEYKRMINIFNSFGGVPINFIRYNPDPYKVDGKIVNIATTKKERTLLNWTEKARNKMPKHACSVLYLFYDNYNKEDAEFYKINPYKLKKYNCETCDFITFIKKLYVNHICEK
jgi:hypothetical protein